MHTNGNNIEHIEFITFIKAARQRSSTAAQLRHENAGLLQIIADFDTRLATVEAERDALQQIPGNTNTVSMSITMRDTEN